MSTIDAPALPDYAPVTEHVGGREGPPRASTETTAKPVIEKHTGILAAAEVFTESTAFWVMESIRLDLGCGSHVHP